MTRVCIIVGLILLCLGMVAAIGIDPSGLTIILPAMPLYLLSSAIDPSARSGMLWDSAHSPPFLNSLGIFCVYFAPGVCLLLFGAFRRK
jgi:hypothetical protein